MQQCMSPEPNECCIILGSNSIADLESVGDPMEHLPFATVCGVDWGLPLFLWQKTIVDVKQLSANIL